ncbi:vicilin Cor a 11.0101-like [Telopea speciosissima]|uniref:vicilin Cor a 11.0101-like n=1 Tax=Telopea speciosissima TaxID=54955 RepID=UPI001CC5B4F4|nr:vicilin Cor a 11.0101-like [Telopea speciosissima]
MRATLSLRSTAGQATRTVEDLDPDPKNGTFFVRYSSTYPFKSHNVNALEREDPELQTCQHQCRHQERFDEREQRECEQRCEEYHKEKQWRQREREDEEEEEEEEQYEYNPYLFDEESWKTTIDEEEGRVRVLERFTKKSKLLRGIDNFRVSIYEANPRTFSVPNHWDAESVSFVTRGYGTISLVKHDNRETFNIKRGDILRIPAGTIVYLVNKDNHEKLQIIDFVHAFSVPGHFETFFGPGGEGNPESFFRAFNIEILTAAFSVCREKVERLFGQTKMGVFLRASEKQIRELTKHASSSEGGLWLFGGGNKSSGAFNLFDKKPSISNNYGKLHEVKPHEFKDLPKLDVGVSFVNISRGAMAGPYFNTRAVKVAVVVQGKGFFEMACPHEHQEGQWQREKESGPHYHKVRGNMSPGVVFVTLPGHPVVVVASNDENLQVVVFKINSEHNERIPVAGNENVIQQLEKEAKELSFGLPEKEVDEVFNNQRESYFFPGPHQRQRHGGGRASA